MGGPYGAINERKIGHYISVKKRHGQKSAKTFAPNIIAVH